MKRPGVILFPSPSGKTENNQPHLVSKRLIVTSAQLTKVVEAGGDGTSRGKQRHLVGVPPPKTPQRQVRDDHAPGVVSPRKSRRSPHATNVRGKGDE